MRIAESPLNYDHHILELVPSRVPDSSNLRFWRKSPADPIAKPVGFTATQVLSYAALMQYSVGDRIKLDLVISPSQAGGANTSRSISANHTNLMMGGVLVSQWNSSIQCGPAYLMSNAWRYTWSIVECHVNVYHQSPLTFMSLELGNKLSCWLSSEWCRCWIE